MGWIKLHCIIFVLVSYFNMDCNFDTKWSWLTAWQFPKNVILLRVLLIDYDNHYAFAKTEISLTFILIILLSSLYKDLEMFLVCFYNVWKTDDSKCTVKMLWGTCTKWRRYFISGHLCALVYVHKHLSRIWVNSYLL
jgi:hypothetical protein